MKFSISSVKVHAGSRPNDFFLRSHLMALCNTLTKNQWWTSLQRYPVWDSVNRYNPHHEVNICASTEMPQHCPVYDPTEPCWIQNSIYKSGMPLLHWKQQKQSGRYDCRCTSLCRASYVWTSSTPTRTSSTSVTAWITSFFIISIDITAISFKQLFIAMREFPRNPENLNNHYNTQHDSNEEVITEVPWNDRRRSVLRLATGWYKGRLTGRSPWYCCTIHKEHQDKPPKIQWLGNTFHPLPHQFRTQRSTLEIEHPIVGAMKGMSSHHPWGVFETFGTRKCLISAQSITL